MKLLYSISLLSIAIFIQACSSPEKTESNPESSNKKLNIIVMLTDDQGYQDLSCYGANDFETPNIDALANKGLKFTNFYVASAVCSASRAGLMTGCYSERVGIVGALMPWDTLGLNPAETTIAEVLKEQGYATGMFGKWHLGRSPELMPTKQGFDEYFGLPYSNDMWPVDLDGVSAYKKKKDELIKGWIYNMRNIDLPMYDGEEIVDTIADKKDQAQLTTRYTERAVNFIKKHKDEPFFMYMPQSMPHVPLAVSDKFKGKSKNGLYGDVIMEIDWSVGEIVAALKETGNLDNTLIVFTSDNGPWLQYGNHSGSALPLREGKGTMWEGGYRVPCVMSCPQLIKEGKVIDKIASTIDLLPTFASLTGAALPTNKIDGIDISGLIKGEDVNPRDTYYCYFMNQLRGVRKGDWKLLFPHKYRSLEGREGGKDGLEAKYNYKVECELELYNLAEDISETNNVASKNPKIVAELQAIADEARKQLGDKLTKTEGSERRPAAVAQQTWEKYKEI